MDISLPLQAVPGPGGEAVDQHRRQNHGHHCEGAETPPPLCARRSADPHLHAHEEGRQACAENARSVVGKAPQMWERGGYTWIHVDTLLLVVRNRIACCFFLLSTSLDLLEPHPAPSPSGLRNPNRSCLCLWTPCAAGMLQVISVTVRQIKIIAESC